MILKGHHTVVADANGRVYVNPTGNPGMATGGTGDVLTGILAALLGQGFQPWDAARFGVYLHGLAGDLAARQCGEVSLAAGDLLEFLPPAIRKILGR
jgi:NAD(P)H-hydrate epimerase